MGLKPEARAMATVTHAAITQVYGIESWRGRPFLVVEHLAGGTLADRLRQEPLPAAEAVSLAVVLGEALATLHRADRGRECAEVRRRGSTFLWICPARIDSSMALAASGVSRNKFACFQRESIPLLRSSRRGWHLGYAAPPMR